MASAERRTRIIVIGSLVCALIVAAVAFVLVRHSGSRLNRQVADARLCTSAASSLELVNPNMASAAPDVGFRTSRTTAGHVVADLERAGSSGHPWDDEAPDTVVVRCQSENMVWLVDNNGHAARAPVSR